MEATRFLTDLVEFIEGEELRIKSIRAGISEQMKLAKMNGFEPKVIRHVMKLRKMSEDARKEFQALSEIYQAALGDLKDLPLGAAAIQRLSQKPPAHEDDDEDAPSEIKVPERPAATLASLEEAKALGVKAAMEGKAVTDNPFPPMSAERAAFDQGWCQASGNTGMEIPAAWRPTKKPKAEKPEEAEQGETPDAGDDDKKPDDDDDNGGAE